MAFICEEQYELIIQAVHVFGHKGFRKKDKNRKKENELDSNEIWP